MAVAAQLEHMYRWEKESPDALWLTWPMGGDEVRELTWGQAAVRKRWPKV